MALREKIEKVNEHCDCLIINRELNKLLSLAYVKYRPNTKELILAEIEDNKQYMNQLKMVGNFGLEIGKDVV